MDVKEMRGLFKGLGIGIILCSAIFYMVVLDLRVNYEDVLMDDDRTIEAALELGMVFPAQALIPSTMTEEEIIEAATKLGMVFNGE